MSIQFQPNSRSTPELGKSGPVRPDNLTPHSDAARPAEDGLMLRPQLTPHSTEQSHQIGALDGNRMAIVRPTIGRFPFLRPLPQFVRPPIEFVIDRLIRLVGMLLGRPMPTPRLPTVPGDLSQRPPIPPLDVTYLRQQQGASPTTRDPRVN